MKLLTLFILLLCTFQNNINAQNAPEVYLADIEFNEEGLSVSNIINISNNTGYDNQPSFLPDGSGVLFSSERGESIDVKLYSIDEGMSSWLTDSEGGKYSPTVTPDGKHFSSIWLKPDGEQLLWKFPLSEGEPKVIIPNEVIGYHTWLNEQTLYTFVLGDIFTFVEFNLGDRISRNVIANNPGRSIHKIPGKEEISFIDKNDSTNWVINSYNPETQKIAEIASTPINSEDMFWVNSYSFLIGEGNSLLLWTKENGYENQISIFEQDGIISRISLNPNRTKIAIVFTEN